MGHSHKWEYLDKQRYKDYNEKPLMTMQGVDMEMMMMILRGEDMEAEGKAGVNAPVHLFSLLQ